MTSPAIAQLPEIKQPVALFLRRVWGIMMRHVYLHLESWPRVLEMVYWPLNNILLWGFTSLYIVKQWTNIDVIRGAFIGGVLLNEIFMRTTFTMLVLFLEEIWSRNLGHLFASPLKFRDYTFGLIIVALIRMIVSVLPAIIVAQFLFHFSLLSLGPPVAAFLVLLALNGCWYGLLTLSLLLRLGQSAEWLGWMSVFLLSPLIAPYYPVSVLPHVLQMISWCIPATYVFECMKQIVNGVELRVDYLWIAFGLNIVYFAIAGFIFYQAYLSAKKRGGILQVGE